MHPCLKFIKCLKNKYFNFDNQFATTIVNNMLILSILMIYLCFVWNSFFSTIILYILFIYVFLVINLTFTSIVLYMCIIIFFFFRYFFVPIICIFYTCHLPFSKVLFKNKLVKVVKLVYCILHICFS